MYGLLVYIYRTEAPRNNSSGIICNFDASIIHDIDYVAFFDAINL